MANKVKIPAADLEAFLRGHGVKVNGKVIEVVQDSIGIKIWGKVDYLVREYGYLLVRVPATGRRVSRESRKG